jgi:hypothetical protein
MRNKLPKGYDLSETEPDGKGFPISGPTSPYEEKNPAKPGSFLASPLLTGKHEY